MFLLKHKTIMTGAAIIALMSVGCVTALAATEGPSLSPAGYVDLFKLNVQDGTYTVGKGIAVEPGDGQTAKTAPVEPLTPVSGNFDTADIREGTFTVVEGITPRLGDGQTAGTASATLTPVSGSIDTVNVQQGTFTVAGGISAPIIDGVSTTAGK